MKKKFSFFTCILSGLFCISTFSFAQQTTLNNTPQAPNFDFEVWDNPEPWGWNSSSCFEAANAASSFDFVQSVWKSSDVRPGSTGRSSAKIAVTKSSWFHFGLWPWERASAEMGTLTTGTLYYHNNKSDGKSCIYTNTGDGSKRWSFTGRPDSIVFWAKLPADNGRVGNMTLYLHDNSELEDRTPNGTSGGTVIGSATAQINYNGGQWVRYSVPLTYQSQANPSYMLLSFTAGKNFREVVEGDQLFIDDVMLIYNPTLSVGESMPSELVRHGSEPLSFTLPYVLTGTMNPFNNGPDNEVIAYISDENGDFTNRREIGRATTAVSGEFQVNLPADFPDSDHYKIQLESTNYPVKSAEFPVKIYREWNLEVKASNAYGQVQPVGIQRVRNALPQTLTATPDASCAFIRWEEGGSFYSDKTSVTLPIERDMTFVACFDTTYTLTLPENQVGANVYFENNQQKTLTVLPGEIARIRTQLDYGYCFYGYLFNGKVYSEKSTDYDMEVLAGGGIIPLVDSILYDFTFGVKPLEKLGSVTGSGQHKHFSTVTSLATPASEYSKFLRWEDEQGKVVSLDTVLKLSDISSGGTYYAVFEEETHKVKTAVNEEVRGSVLQCGNPVKDSVYSAFDLSSVSVEAVPSEGFEFVHWEVVKDGLGIDPIHDNPYMLSDNSHLDSDYELTAVFDSLFHELKTEAEYGKVEGSGTFYHKTQVCLKASADSGYHFSCWVSGQDTLGYAEELCLMLVSDTLVKALFEVNTYEVEIISSDVSLGTINLESGFYAHFSRLELHPEPADLAEFRYWVVDGDTLSSDPDFIWTVNGPCRIEGVFSRARRQVSLEVNDPSFGEVKGEGIYEWGSRVEISALPYEGYRFLYWLDVHSQDTVRNETVLFDSIIETVDMTAVFAPQRFMVSVQAEGAGKAFLGDPQLGQESSEYDYLEQVVLTAEPESDLFEFAGWYNQQGELLSRRNPENLSVRKDTMLVARFVDRQYDLVLSSEPSGAGILSGSGSYDIDSEVEIEAVATQGYEFEGWMQNGVLLSQEPSYRVRMTEDIYLVARFRPLDFQVKVDAHPQGSVVRLEGEGTFPYGLNTRLWVEAADHFELAAWVDASGDTLGCENPLLIDVKGDMEVTAHMQAAKVAVEYRVEPAGAGKVIAGQARYGIMSEIQAEPLYGYRFSSWTDERGQELGNTPVLDFQPWNDTVLIAKFERQEYSVEINAVHGKVEGSGVYRYGDECHLQVLADQGYLLEGWYDEEGRLLSTSASFKLQILSDTVLRVVSVPQKQSVEIQAGEHGEGYVLVDGTRLQGEVSILYGEEVSLEAGTSDGYEFGRWMVVSAGDTQYISDNPLAYKVEGEAVIRAEFERSRYQVEVEILGDQGQGSVNGAGSYLYGEEVVLNALPEAHYRFGSFLKEGEILSSDSVYRFPVRSDIKLQASFQPQMYRLELDVAQDGVGRVEGSGLYAYDSVVMISAVPLLSDMEFSHWSSMISGKDTLSCESEYGYRVENHAHIYAHFKPSSYYLVLESSYPQVELQGAGRYEVYSKVNICAVEPEGHHFQAWTYRGRIVSDQPCMEVTLLSDMVYRAVFVPDTLNLGLSLREPLEGVDLIGAGDYSWGSQVQVRLENLPEGIRFLAWKNTDGETVSEEKDFVLELKSDLQLYAECEAAVYEVRVSTEGEGSVSGQGQFESGQTATLVAKAAEGSVFEGWYLGSSLLETRDTLTLSVAADLDILARFAQDGGQVHPLVNRLDGGSVEFRTLENGREVEFTAQVYEGFRFVNWTSSGKEVSRDRETVLPMESASRLVAHFEPVSYAVEISVNHPEGVSDVFGFGTYVKGETATLKVTLREGYQLDGWYLITDQGEEEMTIEESFELEVDGPIKIEVRVSKK